MQGERKGKTTKNLVLNQNPSWTHTKSMRGLGHIWNRARFLGLQSIYHTKEELQSLVEAGQNHTGGN